MSVTIISKSVPNGSRTAHFNEHGKLLIMFVSMTAIGDNHQVTIGGPPQPLKV